MRRLPVQGDYSLSPEQLNASTANQGLSFSTDALFDLIGTDACQTLYSVAADLMERAPSQCRGLLSKPDPNPVVEIEPLSR